MSPKDWVKSLPGSILSSSNPSRSWVHFMIWLTERVYYTTSIQRKINIIQRTVVLRKIYMNRVDGRILRIISRLFWWMIFTYLGRFELKHENVDTCKLTSMHHSEVKLGGKNEIWRDNTHWLKVWNEWVFLKKIRAILKGLAEWLKKFQ